MLSGVETTKEKVLRIILAGQPELNEKLDAPELIQLVQRIRLRFHLTALTPEETQAYILHRLEVAGAHGRQLFDAGDPAGRSSATPAACRAWSTRSATPRS